MKVRSDYMLRNIAGENIIVPTADEANEIHGIMTLNHSGLLLWNLLREERQEEELTAAILDEYDVDAVTAAADVKKFLERLRQAGILME